MRFIAKVLALLALVGAAPAAQQFINIGTGPNTGTGEPIYNAMQAVNANFTDVYAFLYAPIGGCVSIASGTNVSVVNAGCITNANLAQMNPSTFKCNALTIGAVPQDCTVAQMQALLGTGGGGGGGGGGGTGTLNSVTFTMPSIFAVNTSTAAGVQTTAVTYATGLNANEFLGTPCGSNGTLSLRPLCAGDLPNITGDVNITNGVSAIQPNVVTLPDLAQIAADTFLGNCSNVPANVAQCTVQQMQSILGVTGGDGNTLGSGTPLTNQIDLCTYTGIDPTGTNDSGAAVQAAFNSVAGSNKELEVNCPIRIVIGYNPNAPIFVKSGVNLAFGPAGQFIVDNNTIPAFVFVSSTHITWKNPRIEYIGSLAINNAVSPYLNVSGGFNNSQIATYMNNNLGITFTSPATPYWSGATNICALIAIYGPAHDINFINPRFFVPDSAAATSFIPVVMSLNADWNSNQAVNGNTAQLYPTLQQPYNIRVVDMIADGYYMGIVGAGSLEVSNPIFLRYSDLQDSSGGTQGGTGQWFAPPHALYMTNNDVSFNSHSTVNNVYDLGPYVGGAVHRTTGSGSLLSLKMDMSNGTVVNGYVSFRPDGFMDLKDYSNSVLGGSLKNVVAYYNSQQQTANGGSVWGLRFPDGNAYKEINLENVTLVDTATTPMQFPVVGFCQSGSYNVSITGLKVWVNDWPTTAANTPGFGVCGTNINVQAEYHFLQFSNTGTYLSAVAESGSSYCTGCNFDIKLLGWRQFPVVFSAALASGATSGTLASSWPNSTGNYFLTFPDGEQRYTTLTSGSTQVTAWTALTAAQPASGTQAGNALTANFNGYKPRMLVNYNGGSVNTKAHILDVADGYESFADNGIYTEYWSQQYNGSPNGSSQATNIVFPNTMAIDQNSVIVQAAMNVSFNEGWSANNTALRSAVGASAGTNPVTPIGTAVTLPTNPTTVTLYPTSGSFNGAGRVVVTARGAQMSAAQ